MQDLYIDNHLLAAVKPAGLSTQPHETDADNFLDRAKKWIKHKYDKPGNVFLEPIHRLDKPVSGIVLFARTSKALCRLQAFMREKEIAKTYIALIEGILPCEQGCLEHFLMHGSHRAFVVSSVHSQAKLARLHYRVLQVKDKKSLVEITLETGRYHQIRVQLAEMGCPVIGDRKYGSRLPWKKDCLALHHAKMIVKHPITSKELIFENPPSF